MHLSLDKLCAYQYFISWHSYALSFPSMHIFTTTPDDYTHWHTYVSVTTHLLTIAMLSYLITTIHIIHVTNTRASFPLIPFPDANTRLYSHANTCTQVRMHAHACTQTNTRSSLFNFHHRIALLPGFWLFTLIFSMCIYLSQSGEASLLFCFSSD